MSGAFHAGTEFLCLKQFNDPLDLNCFDFERYSTVLWSCPHVLKEIGRICCSWIGPLVVAYHCHSRVTCFISSTGGKAMGVNETICEADGSTSHNYQCGRAPYVDRFQALFIWPSTPTSSIAIPVSVSWTATTDRPTEAEILEEIRVLWSRKTPSATSLSPAPFRDEATEMVREVLVLLSKVWYSEKVPSSCEGESIVVLIL